MHSLTHTYIRRSSYQRSSSFVRTAACTSGASNMASDTQTENSQAGVGAEQEKENISVI